MDFAALLAAADGAALSVLGGPVRYTTQYGEIADVTGVFDAAYFPAEAQGAVVSSSVPAVFVRLSALVMPDGTPIDPENDDATVTVNGADFRVREVRKDGMGGVVLMLREVE